VFEKILAIGFDNPQNYNPYLYCNNNPLNNVDPDGHFLANLIGAGIGAITGVITVALSDNERVTHSKFSDYLGAAVAGGVAGAWGGGAVKTVINAALLTPFFTYIFRWRPSKLSNQSKPESEALTVALNQRSLFIVGRSTPNTRLRFMLPSFCFVFLSVVKYSCCKIVYFWDKRGG
jgi:hypothetical protein